MEDASQEDWPRGGGGTLCRDLDDAVRCPICGEPFETPLSLRCGHAFCSGCVRSSIEFQERSGPATCPQCRDHCDAGELRPAPQLRAIAAAFLAARPLLLASVTAAITAADEAPTGQTVQKQQQRSQQRRRQPSRQAAPRQSAQRLQQQQQRELRARRQPGGLAPQPNQHQHHGIISVELSSGSEDEAATAAQPKAAARRQQPKRGRAASAGSGENADASQSSGSAKRRQLSSPSTAGDEPRLAPAATAAAAANGGRATRSAGGAAVSAPALSHKRSDSRRGARPPPGAADSAGADSTADEAEQLGSASDSDPEYLGEERPPPSSDDEAAAAVVPPPKPAPAREKLPAGHVRCPNCASMLPSAFINSHLDSCLSGGGKAGRGGSFGGRGTDSGAAAPNGKHSSGGGVGVTAGASAIKTSTNGSCGPSSGGIGSRKMVGGSSSGGLKVPPKLCVALMSDKAMRDTCKKFGLPATGRKEALGERYSRFRLEVQTANDAGEAASYADVARRVLQRESRTAKAAFGTPLARSTAHSSPAGIGDSSFEELIKATRQRQAMQRASPAPATSSAPPQVAVAEAARSGGAGTAAVTAIAAGQQGGSPADTAYSMPTAADGTAVGCEPAAVPAHGATGHAAADCAASQLPPLSAASAPAEVAAPAAAAEPDLLGGAADLAAPGTSTVSTDAAATATEHPALPLLDDQSRSASRGLPDDAATVAAAAGGTAAAIEQHQHGHVANSGGGGVSGAAVRGDRYGGADCRDDLAPRGISCTQRPPPLSPPALSCGQQLQQQHQHQHQPFTFDGAFSDDSRSCPLSPSV